MTRHRSLKILYIYTKKGLLNGKKDKSLLIFSYGCCPETAHFDFKFALSKSSQNDENKAYHLIQSFLPGEVDFDTAQQIGMKLADKVLAGKYSYVVSTHIDRDHIHNHIICAPPTTSTTTNTMTAKGIITVSVT